MTQNGTGAGGSATLYSAVLARGAPPSSDTREYMSDFHIIAIENYSSVFSTLYCDTG